MRILFLNEKEQSSRVKMNHLINITIGNLDEEVNARRKEQVNYRYMISNMCFISKIEPVYM